MNNEYRPDQIETDIQKKWSDTNAFEVSEDPAKEKFYRNLVTILGSPDLADDPRFNSFNNRLENRDILIPILKRLSRQKTTVEWMKLFKGFVPSFYCIFSMLSINIWVP